MPTPGRNPNALPELLIRTESDDDGCDSDDDDAAAYSGHGTFPLVEKDSPYTPAVVRGRGGGVDRNRVRPLLTVVEADGDGVPARKSELCCWWDCHPFGTDRFLVPLQFDESTGVFRVHGNFCSASCAKAYILDRGRAGAGVDPVKVISWFSLMCKRVYGIGICTPVTASPPRFMLDMFGGPFTIEEFREKSLTSEFCVINPPLFVAVQEVREIIHEERQRQEDQKQRYLAASKRAEEDDRNVTGVRTTPPVPKRKRYPSTRPVAPRIPDQPLPAPQRQQPLKLLRARDLPGSKSALCNFMNITTHKRK